jgi:hypothetical protein
MHVRSQTQQCILALVDTSFGHYGHHQANITQELKEKL